MMSTELWQGCVIRLFLLMFCAKHVSTLDNICDQFLDCFDERPFCRMFSNFFKCKEPKCGESTVTGSASKYAMPRIVGGIPAMDREFPWTVYISPQCGGIILDKRNVLTAAHCVLNVIDPRSIHVGYGSINRSMMSNISVARIIQHPLYNRSNQDYDFAVLKLARDFPLSDETNLRGICLPTRRQTYVPNRNCVIAGWGVTSNGGSIIQETMRKATVPLVPLDKCKESYKYNPSILISERQLCAGYYGLGGVDACQSDSGGPLFCADGDQWVLEGVVSTGQGCALPSFPGVYAYVPHNVHWIRTMMSL